MRESYYYENHVKVKNYNILSDEIRRRRLNVVRERHLVVTIFRTLPDMKCQTFLTPDSGTVTTPLEFYFINKHDLMVLHVLFVSNFLQIKYPGRPCSLISVMQPTRTSINGQT